MPRGIILKGRVYHMSSKTTLVGVLVLLCGIMAFLNFDNYIAAFRTPVDFNELTADEIGVNMRVEGDIYAILDQFANEETWTEKNGSKSPKKVSQQYYIIPIGESEFMGLSALPSAFKAYDTVMDATYDYIMDESAEYIDAEPVHFVGKTTKMSDELVKYFTEWFQESEYLGTTEPAVINTYVVPIMLESRSWQAIYIMFAINVALLLVLILLLVLFLRKRKKQASAPTEMPYMAVPNGAAPPPVNPAGAPYTPAGNTPVNSAAPGYTPPVYTPGTSAPSAPSAPAASYSTPDNPDGSRRDGAQNTPDQP